MNDKTQIKSKLASSKLEESEKVLRKTWI